MNSEHLRLCRARKRGSPRQLGQHRGSNETNGEEPVKDVGGVMYSSPSDWPEQGQDIKIIIIAVNNNPINSSSKDICLGAAGPVFNPC